MKQDANVEVVGFSLTLCHCSSVKMSELNLKPVVAKNIRAVYEGRRMGGPAMSSLPLWTCSQAPCQAVGGAGMHRLWKMIVH